MKLTRLLGITLALALLLSPLGPGAAPAVTQAQSGFKVVGYLPSWAGDVNGWQLDRLTHVNYAFVVPNAVGDGSLGGLENPGKLSQLVTAAHARNVKVMLSVGGWNDGNDQGFERLAASSGARATFINNLIGLVNQYGLDGVDIDWEYPDSGASANNYVSLMSELSTAMHSRGKLLTAAVVGSGGDSILGSVFGLVDFLTLMAYDGEGGPGHSPYSYAVASLDYWLGRGLPASKAVLGVPFYERPTWNGYNILVGANPNAPYTDSFVYNGTTVYYNGLQTIKDKTKLALQRGGGVMMWELSQDTTAESTSLLNAIYQTSRSTPPPAAAIPGKVEAESYSAMSGVQTEATTDSGGGQNVGYIDTGDWMDYRVSVASAGSYTVQYRVAAAGSTGQIQLRTSGGTTLATTAVPNTGGWQTWTTAQTTVSLAAGAQTLRVYASGGGFNLNWLSFSSGGGTPCSTTNQARGKTASASTTETSTTPASAAVDGSATTRWSSAYSDPQWLQVDLGAALTVCRVVLSWEAAYATAYKVQVSSDGASWADAYSTTTGDGGLDDISFAARSARYVRVYGSQRATPYGYSLWEFEVFGSTPTQTTLTDDLADWSRTFARSANWTLDSTNPVYFDGDTGRIKRTSNTAESVTYRLGAITSFSAKVYYVNGIDGKVRFFTSPDNATWTALAVTYSAPVNTSGAWYRTTFSPAGALPSGASYLRVEFANDATIYSPQLAQITVTGN